MAEIDPKKPLTHRQAAFVREYLIDLCASHAAVRAGYSKRTAKKIGHDNLGKANIAAAIQKATTARIIRTAVTQDSVIEELRRIAFSDLRDLFTWSEERACFVPSEDLTPEQAAAVSGVKSKTRTVTDDEGNTEHFIELELKTYDKLGALVNLAKHLGMFVEKVEHSGPGGEPIEVKVTRTVVDGRAND